LVFLLIISATNGTLFPHHQPVLFVGGNFKIQHLKGYEKRDFYPRSLFWDESLDGRENSLEIVRNGFVKATTPVVFKCKTGASIAS